MTEYIELEAAIAWFMPYVHAGESIEADVVISDLKGMKAADAEPVRHGRWLPILPDRDAWFCSECKTTGSPQWKRCPVCEAKIDLEAQPTETCAAYVPVITRADKIRARSDEELAEFLRFGFVPSNICFICGNTVSECNDIACRRAVLYWLQQPSEEGTV